MRSLRAALVVLVATAASAVLACPVCGQAKNAEVQSAFQRMTFFMSLTPLLLIAGVVGFVVHSFRKAAREEQAAAASTGGTTSVSIPGERGLRGASLQPVPLAERSPEASDDPERGPAR